ncbi:PREDICTED: uncharacterized protein LOC108766676 [Trachymyrmex cornetzi]|uniref:uncharacterized protein LOC108766676 n=1 Tax=Trachymyrmex cornetzi TaxID=471704 RepID=UPI00084F586B|nr:PREDICTED: uncharacterized protein LOC108766676 [Trachymyrmex cornetzi]
MLEIDPVIPERGCKDIGAEKRDGGEESHGDAIDGSDVKTINRYTILRDFEVEGILIRTVSACKNARPGLSHPRETVEVRTTLFRDRISGLYYCEDGKETLGTYKKTSL